MQQNNLPLTSFTFRLPGPVAAEVRARAEADGRSIGNWLRRTIETALASAPAVEAGGPLPSPVAPGTARLFGGAAQPNHPHLED